MYIYPCVINNGTKFIKEVGSDQEKKKGCSEGYGVPMLYLGMLLSGISMGFMNTALGWPMMSLVTYKGISNNHCEPLEVYPHCTPLRSAWKYQPDNCGLWMTGYHAEAT